MKISFKALVIVVCSSWYTQAQCEVFKSEVLDVQKYMQEMSQLVDSLRPVSELAAFDAQFSRARLNTNKVNLLMGKALTAADEAVILVSEAQYSSEICGLSDAISYTIDAESETIDARDFATEAFEHVKQAANAKNLGNLQYHMRIAQRMIRNAQDAADASVYAADLAHYACFNNVDHAMTDK